MEEILTINKYEGSFYRGFFRHLEQPIPSWQKITPSEALRHVERGAEKLIINFILFSASLFFQLNYTPIYAY
jgi:hypothetical protein